MSGEERLNEFINAVEDWKSSKSIATVKENEEIEIILNLKTEDIKSLSSEVRLHTHMNYTLIRST